MSIVTQILICPGEQAGRTHEEEDTLRCALLAPLACAHGQRFSLITEGPAAEMWGGSKRPETEVYAAAFNFLEAEEFAAWIVALPWLNPGAVRVLIDGEQREAAEIWVLRDSWLVQVLPSRPR